jgi:DNA repair protein RadD
MQLRDYQIEVLDHLRTSLKQGAKAPLLVLPTGAGKTVIFSELAKDFVAKDKKVLILVHRRELVKQACEKLDLIDVDYGVIASGFDSNETQSLQVASVYTLFRRIKANKDFFIPDVIIFDEAHHVAAGTWTTVIDKYNKALRVGVTATPIRLDNKPLGQFFDKLVNGVQVNHLVSKGFLCDHKVFAGAEIPDLSKLKERRGDYQAKDLKEIMDKPVIIGDAVHQYKKHLSNKPAIAFCVDIAHATKVQEQFVREGVKAELLTGAMKLDERDNVLNRLQSKETHVVVSVDVISEGTDLPCVSGAILLRPTKSQALYMQQVGRILRPEKDKTAIVLDHVGNTFRHDFIDIERNWDLEFDYEEEKKNPKPVFITCKNCGFVYKPQKSCPNCGLEVSKKELLAIEGELQELKRRQNKRPETIKKGYESSKYNNNRFHQNNLDDIKLMISKDRTFSFETKPVWNTSFYRNHNDDKQVVVGDNIVYYVGHNQQRFGVVIGFFDKGNKKKYIYPYVVPPINTEKLVYSFPDFIENGKKLGSYEELKANKEIVNKIVFFGKRSQPYIVVHNKYDKDDTFNLYLKQTRVQDGYEHAGHTIIMLTDKGLETYLADDKTGWIAKDTINFKQGHKVRNKMRKLEFNSLLLDKLINIARKSAYSVGYNVDWIYRNYYARKLIDDIQKYYRVGRYDT